MQAFISSPVDAYTLLRDLEEAAGGMAIHQLRLNGNTEPTSTKKTALRLVKTIDGRPTSVTIVRHDAQTLVASLENEQGLVEAATKRCLAALLIPLITKHIERSNTNFPNEERVRIVFGDSASTVSRGKTCLLFAEDAATHSRWAVQPGKYVFSNGTDFSTGRIPHPNRRRQKLSR